MLIASAMWFLTILLPGEDWKENVASSLFWGGSSLGGLFTIYMFGKDFVDTPKLSVKDKDD